MSCGLSKKQPFCDGSHKGTNFKPVKFVAKDQTLHQLCGCKYTDSPPYCNGIHSSLPFQPNYPPCKCNKVNDW